MEMNKLWLERLQSYATKKGIEPDLIDFKSMDWSLSYQEMKNALRKQIKDMIVDLDVDFKSWKEKNESQANERQINHIQEEESRILSEIKTETQELSSFYNQLRDYVSVLTKSDKIHGLVVRGSPSIGKTRQLLGMIDNAVILAGHITPVMLYQTIYQNSDKILIIDDPSMLLENIDSVGILLQALQTEKDRIVQWQSTYLQKLDMLTKTPFSGKVVLVVNDLPKDMEVLLSRCLLRNLSFSFESRAKLLIAFSKQEGISLELSEYAISLMNRANEDRVNFRLLLKANEFYKQNLNWREFLNEELEIDENARIFMEIEAKSLSVADKVKEFKEKTNLSRASYFRLKAKL
jgi:hypothetical protein